MTRFDAPALPGLHHVTAIASDPARNVDFYTRVIGLRLIKRTVNFDDPDVFHLYYGDSDGRPGTILTFFVRRGGAAGRAGNGQVSGVRLAVRQHHMDAWARHLERYGVAFGDDTSWCGARALSFRDPEGLALHLVAVPSPTNVAHSTGTGAAADAATSGPPPVDGLHGVDLSVRQPGPTRSFLAALGLREVRSLGPSCRLAAAGDGPGLFVDVHGDEALADGAVGVGCVHHVAFRAPGDGQQRAWQAQLREMGLVVTEVRDRTYFRSIYFDDPAGIRFEIATDSPGFAVDEPRHALGRRLQLPTSLEPTRDALESRLGPLTSPPATGPDRSRIAIP